MFYRSVLTVAMLSFYSTSWADKTFRDCPDCPEMVIIPAGSFDMGSNNGEVNEKPVHRVTIAKPFAMGMTEVTQGQWKAVMGNNPSSFSNCGDTCPVEQVSWNDAQEYIQKLNDRTTKQYRLPTEAEWEYACYGDSQTEYCGGDDLDSVAWHGGFFGGNSNGTTHPAGQKQANGYGLYDMSGNVGEWMNDCYDRDCAKRVLRGGSLYGDSHDLRAAHRNGGNDPTVRFNGFGFRLARTLP